MSALDRIRSFALVLACAAGFTGCATDEELAADAPLIGEGTEALAPVALLGSAANVLGQVDLVANTVEAYFGFAPWSGSNPSVLNQDAINAIREIVGDELRAAFVEQDLADAGAVFSREITTWQVPNCGDAACVDNHITTPVNALIGETHGVFGQLTDGREPELLLGVRQIIRLGTSLVASYDVLKTGYERRATLDRGSAAFWNGQADTARENSGEAARATLDAIERLDFVVYSDFIQSKFGDIRVTQHSDAFGGLSGARACFDGPNGRTCREAELNDFGSRGRAAAEARRLATLEMDRQLDEQFEENRDEIMGADAQLQLLRQRLAAIVADSGIDATDDLDCGWMPMNTALRAWAVVSACSGDYHLKFQGDGNLVLYQGNRARWASNTHTRGGVVTWMQGDGNLVIYTAQGRPVWASNSNGRGIVGLRVLADGDLVLVNGIGRVVQRLYTP